MDDANSHKRLQTLLGRDIRDCTPAQALAIVGSLINISADLREPDGLRRAIAIAGDLGARLSSEAQKTDLLIFVGNAWSELQRLRPPAESSIWDWEQHELRQAILAYRKAIRSPAFPSLPAEHRSALFTNLANLLNHIGRVVDAIETWDRALKITPGFGMARANRALGLISYGNHLYDEGHRALFLKTALHELNEALTLPLEGGATAGLTDQRERILRTLTPEYLNSDTDLDRFPLGDTEPEREYRKTILDLHLFINPLNDLGRHTIAATDTLNTPPIVVRAGQAPYFQGFLNQIKQEFIGARYLYYRGTRHRGTPHYADRHVHLTDTLDYPAFGLHNEALRASYRIAYSLFDKIAFFLNHYLDLGIDEKKVFFRTLWYSQTKPPRALRPEFARYENLPLRGLYWLAQDLAPTDATDMETLDPDAQNLATIRNALEHKFLKLHTEGPFNTKPGPTTPRLRDPLTLSLNQTAFEQKCRRMLRLSRAAIIHLNLAINREEEIRTKKRPPNQKVARINLGNIPEHDKRTPPTGTPA